jgi:hypothetical protein
MCVDSVAAVAQSVESRIVIPVVVGSSPISRPKETKLKALIFQGFFHFYGHSLPNCTIDALPV